MICTTKSNLKKLYDTSYNLTRHFIWFQRQKTAHKRILICCHSWLVNSKEIPIFRFHCQTYFKLITFYNIDKRHRKPCIISILKLEEETEQPFLLNYCKQKRTRPCQYIIGYWLNKGWYYGFDWTRLVIFAVYAKIKCRSGCFPNCIRNIYM